MSNNVAELHRLRSDFEREASRYPDLTLSLEIVAQGMKGGRVFRKPNHTVMLWQHYGMMGDAKVDELMASISEGVKFGVRGAELTAFGVVEGPDTNLFRRMAVRGGSLVPQAARDGINLEI